MTVHAFAARHGAYVARIGAGEREVVASVVADVMELLGAQRPDEPGAPERYDAPGHVAAPVVPAVDVEVPQDPAVLRLLPDAFRDDPARAAEFRRLTQHDLRDEKVRRLGRLWQALVAPGGGRRGDELSLDPADAPGVAGALTDVRLVLADRLGVRTDADADAMYAILATVPEPDESVEVESRRYLVSVYSALTWLQESLVTLMLDQARRTRARDEGAAGNG